jgi:light-independent protochlorophyllide reductase subunit B
MEKHLIDMFGDAGLEYAAEGTDVSGQESVGHTDANEMLTDSPVSPDQAPDPQHAVWSPDAQQMLKKIPFFVRGRVQQRIERYASERGIAAITTDLVLEAKEAMGG